MKTTGRQTMNPTKTSGISRRSLLASAGAFGAASFAFPHMAVSQDGKVLTVRSYSDLQILDPAFRLSLPEEDIIRAIYPPLIRPSRRRRVGVDGRCRGHDRRARRSDHRLQAEGRYRVHRRLRADDGRRREVLDRTDGRSRRTRAPMPETGRRSGKSRSRIRCRG